MKLLPFLVLAFLTLFAPHIKASSKQAYQDYLYQYDVYRQTYADFDVAKTEYQKFKSLGSQTDALAKTKAMLIQRDSLLRAYLLVLVEKLNEDRGLSPTERNDYQTILTNEVRFLDKHARLVPEINSLGDADTISRQLGDRYNILATTLRRTIIAISLGQLTFLSGEYDATVLKAKTAVSENRSIWDAGKRSTLDRWLLQISNKRILTQQKIDAIRKVNASLSGDLSELDRSFTELTLDISEAKQYLFEGTGFLKELLRNLVFPD